MDVQLPPAPVLLTKNGRARPPTKLVFLAFPLIQIAVVAGIVRPEIFF